MNKEQKTGFHFRSLGDGPVSNPDNHRVGCASLCSEVTRVSKPAALLITRVKSRRLSFQTWEKLMVLLLVLSPGDTS